MNQFQKITVPLAGKIVIHAAAWIIVFIFPFLMYNIRVSSPAFYIKEIINNLFLIGLFYLNAYYLFPVFFRKKRIRVYLLSIFTAFIIIYLQNVVSDHYFFRNERVHATFSNNKRTFVMGKSIVSNDAIPINTVVPVAMIPPPLFKPAATFMGIPDIILIDNLRRSFLSVLLILSTGTLLRMSTAWRHAEKQREVLEKEKLNAELKFLKSQVNPHFLFNTLNSIYSLARKNAVGTQDAILKLSQLMRYMIYESNNGKVPLEKEISYIENYIDLQRLRISSSITINYAVLGTSEGYLIEPMLLIPFIENAFKHGISYTNDCKIDISIKITEGVLHLSVVNFRYKKPSRDKEGGVGLENVRNRLHLLYPDDKSSLVINQQDNYHIVNLSINLKHV